MSAVDVWEPHVLERRDAVLTWYEAGSGPTVVFVHGGPGHDHTLMRRLAQPLTATHRCVLYDQRGSGESVVTHGGARALHVVSFIEDLEALRVDLGDAQLTLAGWSWGASLALLYALRFPERVRTLALVAPGPIALDMLPVLDANRVRVLDVAQRAEHAQLVAQQQAAFNLGDAETFDALEARLLRLTFRSWFYDPALADDEFAAFSASLRPYAARRVSDAVLPTMAGLDEWKQFDRVTCPVTLMYGYQDFEPITQAFTLREWLPQLRLKFINACGHMPWIEQPEVFYPLLRDWLDASVVARPGDRA